MPDVGIRGCPYYSEEFGQIEWCDQDPVTPHHGEKVIDGSVAEEPSISYYATLDKRRWRDLSHDDLDIAVKVDDGTNEACVQVTAAACWLTPSQVAEVIAYLKACQKTMQRHNDKHRPARQRPAGNAEPTGVIHTETPTENEHERPVDE